MNQALLTLVYRLLNVFITVIKLILLFKCPLFLRRLTFNSSTIYPWHPKYSSSVFKITYAQPPVGKSYDLSVRSDISFLN